MIKAWSKDQRQIAKSSAEAELYAANYGAEQAKGIQSFATDLNIPLRIELCVDASASKGIMERRGLGKTRHIEVQDLWLQDQIEQGTLRVRKIHTDSNVSDMGTKPLDRCKVEAHMCSTNQERTK